MIARHKTSLLTDKHKTEQQALLHYLAQGDPTANPDNSAGDAPGDFSYLRRVYGQLLDTTSGVMRILDPGNRQISSDRDHNYASGIISINHRIQNELERLLHVRQVDERQRTITNRTMAGIGRDLQEIVRDYQQGN